MDSAQSSGRRRSMLDNWVSLAGFILAMVFLAGEIVIIAVDFIQGETNPYVGILIYIVGPAILVTGLLMVPFGMWLEYRRQKRGGAKPMPVIDLTNPVHRARIVVFSVVTTVFLVLTMVGSYQAFHITESNEFCGVMCHQVMTPEYTAYQNSPHARVDCVQCHIGPGADWFVRSKLSGAWQVYAVLTNSYELPIDTPIENLRPAMDTCEQCHWPQKFYASVEKELTYYSSDGENTPYRVDLLLHVGPGEQKRNNHKTIHWHIGLDHTMEYYATDEDRQEIPWVRVTYADGTVEEFVDENAEDFDPESIPPGEIRVLDCIDCHNRPSHRFKSPFAAVNEAFDGGALDPQVPDLKAYMVEALRGGYETTPEAMAGIEEELRGNYEDYVEENPDKRESIDQAVATAKDIFQNNIFPEWKADWSKYPWNIGHYEFPGCYRCHDDNHKTAGGKAISYDCNVCHTIVRQGEGWEEVASLEYRQQDFVHPRGFPDAHEGSNCHECHGPGMM